MGSAYLLDKLSSEWAYAWIITDIPSESEWGPSARWKIAIWVGPFTHLSNWRKAARKSPDEVIQNRHVSSFQIPKS